MRHGNSDTTKPDQIDADINDCATQRPLSQEGKRIVTSIGKIIRKAKIPVGEIHSSPMCRAKDSALLAFGKTGSLNADLRYTANMTDKQKFQALDTIRELVSMQVSGHTNRAIVAHSQNIMALIGYLPSPEGTTDISSIEPKSASRFADKAQDHFNDFSGHAHHITTLLAAHARDLNKADRQFFDTVFDRVILIGLAATLGILLLAAFTAHISRKLTKP